MEKDWISVELCEVSVGIDCSDKTVTFRLSLQSQNNTERQVLHHFLNKVLTKEK